MNTINFVHTSERHNPKDALEVLPFIFKLFNPNSVLDIGCANGSWLAASKTLGVKQVFGVDGIQVKDTDFLIEASEFLHHDLRKPIILDQKFDMGICLEVAEHLPETASDNIVDILCNHCNIILFSAAIPGQGGQHHINEQWPDYWQKKFKEKGFLAFDIVRERFWDNTTVFWWYRQNMVVYIKEETTSSYADLVPSPKIKSLVHPELFRKKIFRPKYYNRTELWMIFKMVVKAYIQTFR